jgi:hypothetical protein
MKDELRHWKMFWRRSRRGGRIGISEGMEHLRRKEGLGMEGREDEERGREGSEVRDWPQTRFFGVKEWNGYYLQM